MYLFPPGPLKPSHNKPLSPFLYKEPRGSTSGRTTFPPVAHSSSTQVFGNDARHHKQGAAPFAIRIVPLRLSYSPIVLNTQRPHQGLAPTQLLAWAPRSPRARMLGKFNRIIHHLLHCTSNSATVDILSHELANHFLP